MHKRAKKIVSGALSLGMIASALSSLAPALSASAGLVVGESSFAHKALPWHTCESSPAKQDFELTKDGTFHVIVEVPKGGDGEKWDLQVRHRNLNFKSGHEYKVSCKVKGSRAGMELCSKIGDISGDNEYFELDGGSNDFHMGPHMGGQWPQAAVKLTTDWVTYEGTFKPTEDLEACEWTFHYAKGTKWQGNAEEGDEIWFDDLIIDCVTCGDKAPGEGCCNADPDESYGATNRDYAATFDKKNLMVDGKTVNFISVNQVGYYPELAKIATLSDNKGDILYGATTIDLKEGQTYDWELCNTSGTAVASGKTGKAFHDKDSDDIVAKIDFSDYTKEGEYFLRIKGEKWRSFNFAITSKLYTDTTHNMLTNALNYFYQNRSGLDIESKYITSGDTKTLAHEGGHKVDKAYVQTQWKNEYSKPEEATSTYASSQITANKGWYDAGDHGKYVVNGGISVWTLQNMYERAQHNATTKAKFKDGSGTVVIPEQGNGIPDILDECKYELDFIEAMKVDGSEPTWGKYEGMVYHKLHDHKWTGLATKPWDYEGETLEDGTKGWNTRRIVKPPTFAATLNYAACSAQAARLWNDAGKTTEAKHYLEEAVAAYNAYKPNWYEAAKDEEKNPTSLYAPFNQAKGGGPYGDNEVRDDDYWAACEIFVSASRMKETEIAATFKKHMEEYKDAYTIPARITGGENQSGTFSVFNWGNTASAGSMSLLINKDLLSSSEAKKLEDSLLDTADQYLEEEDTQGYGIPYKYDGPGYTDENNLKASIIIKGYEWGSNSMVINNLIAMSYAYDISGNKKYLNGVVTGMDYLLGNNPLSFSFVTGYGTYKEKNPHHRYWSHELDKTLPLAPDGVLSGGPNAGLQDPYVRALGFVPGKDDNPSQRCFVDSIEAWSTNEVTINWNAPLAWIVEFLQDKDETYDYGTESKPDETEPEETTTTPETGRTFLGDVDCDGDVTVADAVMLARYLAEDKEVTVKAQGLVNAHCVKHSNADTLNADDLTAILEVLANLIKQEDLPKAGK